MICRLVDFAFVVLKLLMVKVCVIIGISEIEFSNFSGTERVNHRAIQKVCHLHNGIFQPIQLCHTFSILLYHFPSVIH